MKRKMRKVCMVVALALAMLFVGQAALAEYSAKVLTSSMTVYSPYSSGTVLGTLPQGTSFTVTGIYGNWAYVNYKGNYGFASMQNIIFDSSIHAYANCDTQIKFVTKSSYSQRVAYTGTIAAGTGVYVRGVYNGYLLIADANSTVLGIAHQSDFTRG